MKVQAVREVNSLVGAVPTNTLKTMLTNLTGLYDPPDELELSNVASDCIYSRLRMIRTVGEAMPDIIDKHIDHLSDSEFKRVVEILMLEKDSNLYFVSGRLADAILPKVAVA